MKQKKHLGKMLVIVLFSIWMPSWATTIILKSNVSIEQRDILIGDIATVETQDLGKKERIENIKVGSVNRTGRAKSVNAPQIAYWLKRNQINPDQVKINGQSQVTYRVTNPIKTDMTFELLKRVQTFYQESLQVENVEVKVKTTCPPLPLITPETRMEFHPKGQLEDGRLALVIYDHNRPYRLALAFDIQIQQPVVISTIDIPAQSRIELEFLRIENRALNRSVGSFTKPMTQTALVAGQISKRQIRKGQIITQQDLQKQYHVKRGDVITVIAQRGALKIQTHGVANENGNLGQLIRIKNITSKKVIIGKVIDKKTVQVKF